MKALGEFRDEDSAKALIGILDEGDASYYVEGEAARSLGKTRSLKAFDVLKKNLRKESFLDVIRVGFNRWEMETTLVEFAAERRLRKI